MDRRILITALMSLVGQAGFAQLSAPATWATHATNEYQAIANVTYLVASNSEQKLDVYKRRDATGPQPTLIFIHGGGWVQGTKEQSLMSLMPWFEMGWNVVNVEYRLGRVALAPAAVEDCLCALRYVATQAKTYDIDPTRLVVMGESAGGHLALTTGMIPESAGLDRQCPGAPLPRWPRSSTGTGSQTWSIFWTVQSARPTPWHGWAACQTARRSRGVCRR